MDGTQLKKLQEPLVKDHVKTREQSGQTLSYVDGYYVISRANEIFEFDGWNYGIISIDRVQEEQKPDKYGKDKWWVGYVARVKVDTLGVTREDVGFGSGIDADLGRAHESAIKEAVTDALKRALRTFGDSMGLALYDKTMANVVASTPPPVSTVTTKVDASQIEEWTAKMAGDQFKAWGGERRHLEDHKLACTARKVSWVDSIKEGKDAGCQSLEEFVQYFTNGVTPPNGK